MRLLIPLCDPLPTSPHLPHHLHHAQSDPFIHVDWFLVLLHYLHQYERPAGEAPPWLVTGAALQHVHLKDVQGGAPPPPSPPPPSPPARHEEAAAPASRQASAPHKSNASCPRWARHRGRHDESPTRVRLSPSRVATGGERARGGKGCRECHPRSAGLGVTT